MDLRSRLNHLTLLRTKFLYNIQSEAKVIPHSMFNDNDDNWQVCETVIYERSGETWTMCHFRVGKKIE
jgi:hypothetical protein